MTDEKHPLIEFLETRRVDGDHPATITGTTESLHKGPWSVSDEDYPELLDLLHESLFQQKRAPLGLVERDRTARTATGQKPLLVDLDFEFPTTINLERRITKKHLEICTKHYVDALNKFFDLSVYDELRFFISQRPTPYKKGGKAPAIKDGIHLECPDIGLTNENHKVIRQYLLEKHAIQETFSDIDAMKGLREDKIYDVAMTRSQGWYFYGETKPGCHPYMLTAIFIYRPSTEQFVEGNITEYTARNLIELMSIRYNLVEHKNTIREEANEKYMKLLKEQGGTLPPAPPPDMSNSPNAVTDVELIIRSMMDNNGTVSTDDIPLIERLVRECLSTERADDRNKWMEVGWCLYHVSSNNEMLDKMFALWLEFSKKSPKWTENNESILRREWLRMGREASRRTLKWGSLQRWCKEDNPDAFSKIMDEDLITYISIHTRKTNYHVAEIVKRMYKNKYMASVEAKQTEWYTFVPEEHVWKHINQGMELRNRLSREVVKKLIDARERVKTTSKRDNNTDEIGDYGLKRIKELLAVENTLYMSGSKDAIMKECAGLMHEEDLSRKFNINPNLFVCRNGVLNLRAERTNHETGEKEIFVDFRPGCPEDMMTFIGGKTMDGLDPITYIPYNPSGPYQAELQEFFAKIFPRPDLREYVITLLSSCLEGQNREQCFYFWYGSGGNGKSKILDLVRFTFGEYQKSLATTALTRKRPDAGAANPDIMAIKNRRFIYMGEPDDKEPLNTSRMKQISGEDIIEARELYSNQDNFKVAGKLHLLTNDLPAINTMDRGTWRRIRVIPFESKFVDENDKDYGDLLAGRPNIFPKDIFLEEKLKLWREAFLSLLVHTFETVYCKKGMMEPDIVKSASTSYKEVFDDFEKFLRERVREMPETHTDIKKFTSAYKTWSGKASLRGNDAATFKKRMEDKWGPPEQGKTFRNLVVFETDEDTAEFDAGRTPATAAAAIAASETASTSTATSSHLQKNTSKKK